jgi:hypothetical protein
MERQRQYLKALRSAILTKMEKNDSFLMEALDEVSPYMVSDCTVNQLSQLYNNLESYTDSGIQTVKGEAKVGEEFMEFYPDEAALKQLVVELFYVPLEE